ncbi:dihydroxyacetone kinase phosphoryl donor subunit DhaM [Actinokineospora guangxiensis]|uniref:phosphoenolpyruvate--glycerone phosphotransferase n=1 Tax=Actinokineospora guangxiensis TaxID=1490288 RepID=A0ABW0EFV5_9PSEU
MSRVGLVLVSHSAELAAGLARLAAQMAPDVTIVPAGGADGDLGTDFDLVSSALARAQSGAGVVLLYDLGSAKLVADIAVEMLGDPGTAAVVDAPFVEGAIAAAVAAQSGDPMDAVLSAAASALAGHGDAAEADHGHAGSRIDLVLTNDVGLHARPAGLVVRSLAGVDAQVTVSHAGRTADARSVLALLGLGAHSGATITVAAEGPDAAEALTRIRALAESHFTD